jgi:hypothetical protein
MEPSIYTKFIRFQADQKRMTYLIVIWTDPSTKRSVIWPAAWIWNANFPCTQILSDIETKIFISRKQIPLPFYQLNISNQSIPTRLPFQ